MFFILQNSKSNAGHMTSQLGEDKVADSPAMPMLPQSSPMLNQPGPSPAAGSTCSSNTSEHVSSSTQVFKFVFIFLGFFSCGNNFRNISLMIKL